MPHLFQLSLKRKSRSSTKYAYNSPKRKEGTKQTNKEESALGKAPIAGCHGQWRTASTWGEKHIVTSGLWLPNKAIYTRMSTLELGDIGTEGPIIILVYTAHRQDYNRSSLSVFQVSFPIYNIHMT